MAFKNGLIMNNPYPKISLKCLELVKVLVEFIKPKEVWYRLDHFWDPGDIDLEGLLIQLVSLCDDAIFFFSILGIFQNQRLCPLVDLEVHCPA